MDHEAPDRLDGDDGQIDAASLDVWPPGEWEMPLRTPVTHAEETHSSLLLREPNGAEWEKIMGQPEVLRRRFAVHHIAGIPMQAAAKIGIGDLVRAENYLNSFFEVGQVIGVS